MKEKIGVNDMNNVSGGFGIRYASGEVQLTGVYGKDKDKIISYFKSHANEVVRHNAISDSKDGGKAFTYGDWAERLEGVSGFSPTLPVDVALEIFPENARLQRLSSR